MQTKKPAESRDPTDTVVAITGASSAGEARAATAYLRPEDVANATTAVLQQSRHVRTTQWHIWSTGQGN